MAGMWTLRQYQIHGSLHLIYTAAAFSAALWFAKYPEQFAASVSYLGAIQAIFGLAQYLGWNPWGYELAHYLNKPSGTFGQETILGAFLAFALAPALFTRRYLCALPILLCILATNSTMSILSGAAVFLIWLFALAPGLAFLLTLSAIILGLASFLLVPHAEFFSTTGRVEFWKLGWAEFLKHPITGSGPGSWQDTRTVLRGGLWITYLHNEYLECLVEYGLLGGAIIAAGLLGFFRRFRLTWHHAGAAGILVNAFGNFPLHHPVLGTLFLTAWFLSVRESPDMLQFERCETR